MTQRPQRQSPRPSGFAPERSSVLGDVSGGFASAIVAITGNVAAGVIAFAPMGSEHVGLAIVAGMMASIVAGTVAALFGAPGMISGPKATTAMAFAAMVAELIEAGGFDLSDPQQVRGLLALSFLAVLLSGVVQAGLGAFRVGTLVKFVPYPVVAGIRNTAALLLIYGQLFPALGVPRQSLGSLAADVAQIQPATALIALSTALVARFGGRVMHRAAVPVMALAVGSAVHYLLPLALDVRVGTVLGAVPAQLPRPQYLGDVARTLTTTAYVGLLPIVVSGALAIAVLDSISALITLVSFQSLAGRRFDANRQLAGQGIGSVVGAVFGGLSTSGIFARAAMNYGAGGRGRLSGVASGLSVLVLVLLLARPLSFIPKASLAGLIIVIALGIFDRWSLGLVREALQAGKRKRQDLLWNLGVMALVIAVGVKFNLVDAVGVGVALSLLFFVARMSRSPIKRVRTGHTVRSRRNWDPHVTETLKEHGDRIVVLELEGPVFFGSCDAVANRIEELAGRGADFVVVDMKRVEGLDMTGYKVLGQTFLRLRAMGVTMGFGYVPEEGAGSEYGPDLTLNGVPRARLFPTTDQALEYFEEGLLLRLRADEGTGGGWTPADFGRSMGLTEDEIPLFGAALERRRYSGGEYVVRERARGESMFFVGQGEADVTIPIEEEGRERRLATVSTGTMIGEMAILDGRPRSADVRARGRMVCYELTRAAIEDLRKSHPQIAVKLFAGIGRVLGARLRDANDLIEELDR